MFKNKILFVLLGFICLFLFACGEEPTPGPTPGPIDDPEPIVDPVEEDTFEVKETEVTLEYGESKKLTITKSSDKVQLTFKTNKAEVAEVANDGTITAKGQGEAIITVEMAGGESATVKVKVNAPSIEINGKNEMLSNEAQTLTLKKSYSLQETIVWTSNNTAIATVSEDGKVEALSGGEVEITAKAMTSGAEAKFTIKVTQVEVAPTEIVITANVGGEVYLDTNLILTAEVLPKGAKQDVTWTCANSNRATIDPDGYVNIIKDGKVTIKCSSNENPDIKASFTFNVLDYIDPEQFIMNIFVEHPLNDQVKAFGFGPIKEADGLTQIDFYEVLAGSVSLVGWDFDWILNEGYIVPKGQMPRPGTIREVRYVTVHDTATTHSHTTAYNLANNLYGRTSDTTGWHYSCGSGVAFHSIPDNEVGYHAGDGTSVAQVFTDTGVKAIGNSPAWVTISSDGYWEFTPYYRGKYDESLKMKSNIEVPEVPIQHYSGGWVTTGYRKAVTSDLPNDTSIINYVGENGNYWMTNTWWSQSYQTLSNRGGNCNSVGIESTVNYGADLYRVWMTLAKLIATKILPNNNLTPDAVKQHNTFSGKNCPETMRAADLWPYFMKMVNAEYTLFTKLRDFTITFDKGDTDLINESGQIVKWPDQDTPVTCTYHVVKKDGTYDKTFTLTSIIPAKITNCKLVGAEDPYYYMTPVAREKQVENANTSK